MEGLKKVHRMYHEKQIAELADEVTESFWKKNKDRLLNEACD